MLRHNVVLYCNRCKERTVHKFISSETNTKYSPLTRLFFGIFSLGASEMINEIADEKYYKYTECGHIRVN